MPKTSTSFDDGNQAATKHGARSYLDRTKDDRPITADMAALERSVLLTVATDGPKARVEKQAARFAVASELVWARLTTEPDAENAVTWLKLWGWLSASEIRAWRDHASLPDADAGDREASKILASYKVTDDDKQDR